MLVRSWERPPGVELRLILIRHGEPDASAKGRCYGKLDVGLSDGGRSQMARLAEALSGAEVEALYASPRRRAAESAAALGDEVRVDPRLAEIDFGELEGLRYEEAEARFPQVYEDWMRRPTEVRFPGGESFADLRARVLDAARTIREAHRSGTVAIVSHGGVNRILLAEALGMAPRNVFHMDQSHAGTSVIDDYPAYSVVRVLNATC